MGRDIIIRKALQKEARILDSIRYQCWKRAYSHIYEEEEIDRYFQGKTKEQRTWPGVQYECIETFAAERNDTIRGYAKFGWNMGGRSELLSFYVSPEKWNKGIGSQLWCHVVEMNRCANIHSMDIWVLKRAKSAEFYVQKGCFLVDQGDYFIGDHQEVAQCYRWFT